MPNATLEPSRPLVLVSAGGGDLPPPKPRFVLFGDGWLTVQCYVTQALQLPFSTNDFTKSYGTFADAALVKQTTGALQKVHDLAAAFGSPATLKTQLLADPRYLLKPTPPAELYGHIVWVANQIYQTSSFFQYTLDGLVDLLLPLEDDERLELLKTILIGPDGLVSQAESMKAKTAELITKLTTFDGNMSAANEQLQRYAGKGSEILARATQLAKNQRDKIDNELQPAADSAWRAWRDYTIAATVTSVGLMVLAGGLLWPVAVGLGVGLGVAAAKMRTAYNDLIDQIHQAEEEARKKTLLVADMTSFNASITRIAPAMTEFLSSLREIEGVWTDISLNLAFIANSYTVENVQDLPVMTQSMKIADASKKWHAIGQTATEFTRTSLVSFSFAKPLEKLPVK